MGNRFFMEEAPQVLGKTKNRNNYSLVISGWGNRESGGMVDAFVPSHNYVTM